MYTLITSFIHPFLKLNKIVMRKMKQKGKKLKRYLYFFKVISKIIKMSINLDDPSYITVSNYLLIKTIIIKSINK